MTLSAFLNEFNKEFSQTDLKYYINNVIKPYIKYGNNTEFYVIEKDLDSVNKKYICMVGFVLCEFRLRQGYCEAYFKNTLNNDVLQLNSSISKWEDKDTIEEINSRLFNIFD